MEDDGTALLRLTTNTDDDVSPTFTPDGSKIAFVSNRDGNTNIYIMDADGSNQTRLTNNQLTDFSPAWSPDGTRIVFTSERDGNAEIYTMLADGSNQTNLSLNPADDSNPVWTTGKITFQSDRNGNLDIFSFNDQNGGGLAQLTSDAADDTDPALSLNNRELAFMSTRDGNYELYTANADGSNPLRVTTDAASDFEPTLITINIAPTLDAVGNVNILEDAATQNINLSGITAGQDESQSLTVTATSNNPSLIPNPAVTYTSPNSTASISFTPLANAFGMADITVTVTDNGGTANGGQDTSAPQFFTITINGNHDAPTSEILIGLTATNELFTFNSNAPNVILARVPVTGLLLGEIVIGIDYRPANNQLYGFTNYNRLVTLNPASGAATVVAGLSAGLLGNEYGFDFNPTNDRLRIVNDTDQNASVNPDDGTVTLQTPLNPGNPNVTGAAYSNNVAGAATTTLYDIDSNLDILVRQGSVGGTPTSPNSGQLFTVGTLGFDTSAVVGFDIWGANNAAYATLQPSFRGLSRLYSINLAQDRPL